MMALTAAEKQRRYRERIKNDPEKKEKQRKKDLERVRQKRKKVSELNNKQKNKIREQWKIQKRRQRNKTAQEKNQQQERNNVTGSQSSQNNSNVTSKHRCLKKKCNFLSRKCDRLESRLKALLTLQEKQRKRHYRMKIQADKKTKQLEAIVEKMRAREEILEATLKKTYKDCETRSEKRLVKSLATNSKAKTFVAKLIGLTGRARTKETKRKRNKPVHEDITKFYLRDDVSRCTAGKKECRTKNKQKHQIRYMLDTFHNLFQKYKDEGGKSKFTTFYRCKPFYVLAPHLASRDTCICIKHNNIELKFAALKKHSVIPGNLKEVLSSQSCDLKSFNCMHGKCNDCKQISLSHCANDEKLDQNVTWYQWERIDHQYTKKEGTSTKTVTTKKTVKSEKTGKLVKLLQEFETEIIQFKKHYFNVQHQQNKYQTAVSELKENEALIVCDFSENYETKLSQEIQSMHFGASKSQVTLHTGMVYFKDKAQSFCTVSENNTHQPPAIWAHLQPILNMIKEGFPEVSVMHYYSDGPTSQYRQKNNFYLLDLFTEDLKLDYASWSYFESGHGKGVADGIGGSVKRVLDRQVCFGRDISSALDAYKILKECMKVVKVWYIADEDINRISCFLPRNVPTLVGTMQLHQIITRGSGTVTYRDIGCFCGENKGLCGCFGPKTHQIRSNAALENTINHKDCSLKRSADQTPTCSTAIKKIIYESTTNPNSDITTITYNKDANQNISTNSEEDCTLQMECKNLPVIEDATVEAVIPRTVDAQNLPFIEDGTIESVTPTTVDAQHLPVIEKAIVECVIPTTVESVTPITVDAQHLPVIEDATVKCVIPTTVESVTPTTVDAQHLPVIEDATVECVIPTTVESVTPTTVDTQHLPVIEDATVDSVIATTFDTQHLPVNRLIRDATLDSVIATTVDTQHLPVIPVIEAATVEYVIPTTVESVQQLPVLDNATIESVIPLTVNIQQLPVIFYDDNIENYDSMNVTTANISADVNEVHGCKENSILVIERHSSTQHANQTINLTQDHNTKKNQGNKTIVIKKAHKKNTLLQSNRTASGSSPSHLIVDRKAACRIPENKTINKSCKPIKTLKTIVKRQFHCDGCKASLQINRIAKCIGCRKWFCWKCSGGYTVSDYVCEMCLLSD